MDHPNSKSQKNGNDHASLQGTPYQSSIFSHNRRDRIEFLERFNELKHGSVTNDIEEINTKRQHVISILGKIEQAPIRLPYASTLLKSSYESLHDLRQNGENYSSNNIIDLDPDKGNAGICTCADVGNIGAGATLY